MKTLTAALTLSAFIIGGTAAHAMTIAPGLTPSEYATVKQLVPEAVMLHHLTDRQASALSDIASDSDQTRRADARRAALNVIAEQPWLLPSRPGTR